MTFERYAVYWAPRAESSLAAFARGWLGGDVETGSPVEPRRCYGLDAELAARATASPRRYGVHATLKAPFRLADDTSGKALAAELASFAARRRVPRAGSLKLHRFPQFLALVPTCSTAELEWLAAECVTHFDRFRAPLSDCDRARRVPNMSGKQAVHFEQFGYPHIFEHFMFHITLAGPLDEAALDEVEAALTPAVAQLTEDAFIADDLCLAGDPGHGEMFRILYRAPFQR